ncbi:MAG: hypothetical protein ACK4FB_06455 [Brevundimonas sp.]|uniref:hypothetical protein n=1 Tax=Brevundimonas sp. TaxID=1871086 RepID=UPI00391DAB9B
MSEFRAVRNQIADALKGHGMTCDAGKYDPEHFGNWIIQFRRGGPPWTWHGRIVSDRGQVLVNLFPNAPAEVATLLPDFSADLEEFIQAVGSKYP